MARNSKMSRRALLAGGAAAMLNTSFLQAVSAQSACEAPALGPLKPRIDRAVSLRQVIKLLAAGDTARLEGLTRLDGYIIDQENNDIGLIGLSEPNRPELQTADFIVALRSSFLRGRHGDTDYDKSAAISIDPNPDVFRHLHDFQTTEAEGRRKYVETCKSPQKVRVDGMARHTRVAKVLIDADYRMKQVSEGVVTLPIPMPFRSDFDTLLEDWRSQIVANGKSTIPADITRYWFTPGKFDFVSAAEGPDTVFLDTAQVILKDEAEVLRSDAKEPVPTGKINPYARAFTCAWTARMEDTYKAEPIWRDMHNIYRHFAIARIMCDRGAFDQVHLDLGFLLERYEVPNVEVPDTLPGLSRIETYVSKDGAVTSTNVRSVCGGVQVGFPSALPERKEVDGEIQRESRTVLASRPSQTTLAWSIVPGSLKGLVPRSAAPASSPPPTMRPAGQKPSLQDLFHGAAPSEEAEPPRGLQELFKEKS